MTHYVIQMRFTKLRPSCGTGFIDSRIRLDNHPWFVSTIHTLAPFRGKKNQINMFGASLQALSDASTKKLKHNLSDGSTVRKHVMF